MLFNLRKWVILFLWYLTEKRTKIEKKHTAYDGCFINYLEVFSFNKRKDYTIF